MSMRVYNWYRLRGLVLAAPASSWSILYRVTLLDINVTCQLAVLICHLINQDRLSGTTINDWVLQIQRYSSSLCASFTTYMFMLCRCLVMEK